MAKDDFYDFAKPLLIFDIINNIDAMIYFLIAASFIKTFVFWLPSTFRVYIELLNQFMSRQTLFILMTVYFIALMGNELLGAALLPYIKSFSSYSYRGVRSNVLTS